jgi:hypothetical protein
VPLASFGARGWIQVARTIGFARRKPGSAWFEARELSREVKGSLSRRPSRAGPNRDFHDGVEAAQRTVPSEIIVISPGDVPVKWDGDNAGRSGESGSPGPAKGRA